MKYVRYMIKIDFVKLLKINNLKKLFQKWGVPPLISVFIYISSYFYYNFC